MKTSWKLFATSLLAAVLIWKTTTPVKAWLDAPFSSSPTFIWHWQPVPLNPNNVGSQTTSKNGKKKRKSRIKKSGGRSPKVSAASKKRPSPVKTSFRSSAAVRKRNFARFVAKTRAVDPQGAVQLQQTLASMDIIAALGPRVAPFGLKTNDVADAMTIYLVGAWSGVRGHTDNPTRAQCLAIRRQIVAAAQRTPQFAGATDAQKQELAEAMLIQAVLLDQAVTSAKDNAEMMDKVKAAIAQGAQRTFGLDLRRVQLTNAGVKLIN